VDDVSKTIGFLGLKKIEDVGKELRLRRYELGELRTRNGWER
jgi:hypothetical protein